MKRLAALLVFAVLLGLQGLPAFGQIGTFPALVGQRGTTLPANCSVGQLFFKTNATAGRNIYACTTANTWTVQGPVVVSGTSALGTSAISSGACATAVTTTATGTLTTDVIGWGFNGDPTGVTGYAASANGMLTIISYPSSGNVNFKVCNNTAGSITPGAITLNWKVLR